MTNDQIIRYAREIGTDEDEMIEALAEVPVMPKQQFARICQALFLIANQMSQLALQNVLQARAIVARQEAEEALRQSENRLQQLSANLIIAQEEERKRLAAELHDGIGQSLTAAKYGIDSVLQSIPKNDHLHETLITAADVLKNVIHEVRKMQTELRPQLLDDLGIVATINWFCREYQTIFSQISIIKQINISETAIPAALKPVIYRIMQEAMNNIAKHSGGLDRAPGYQRGQKGHHSFHQRQRPRLRYRLHGRTQGTGRPGAGQHEGKGGIVQGIFFHQIGPGKGNPDQGPLARGLRNEALRSKLRGYVSRFINLRLVIFGYAENDLNEAPRTKLRGMYHAS